MKHNLIQSYLKPYATKDVKFRTSFDFEDTSNKEESDKIAQIIRFERNLAFMLAYILVLYYDNTNILPTSFNNCMQF